MPIEALKCPNCAAPVPPSVDRVLVCQYCNHVLTGVPTLPWGRAGDAADEERPDDVGRPRVQVAGRAYVILGRLAQGDSSDVFLARRDARLTEMVTLKVLRANADADLLAREWKALDDLSKSEEQGAPYFRSLLPQPVAHGKLRSKDTDARLTSVFRWRSGFQHTFEDITREYPSGVDPRAAVWLWKRALELLGWVHRSGFTHGAIVPQHLLVHPRDHGVVLVGWSCAVRGRDPLPAVSARARVYYPDGVFPGAPVTQTVDLVMLARCIARVLGGDPARGRVPESVPAPLASLVREWCMTSPSAGADDPWELMERVSQAGKAAFGPARYVPFHLPGWS